MLASRLANLNHGQKKADTEISVSQTEAAELLKNQKQAENNTLNSIHYKKKLVYSKYEPLKTRMRRRWWL